MILVALFAPYSPLDSLGLYGAFLEISVCLLWPLNIRQKPVSSWRGECQEVAQNYRLEQLNFYYVLYLIVIESPHQNYRATLCLSIM
ncbi:hypothetical protein THF1A12_70055 [Vibrio jasicida]|uniref:Uncharacterized protein n=1 Tax=Vibrio jasicida TaxID=766224 RepID=A0AAU9QVY7_9VIBR|nr:hypothetical protein THF1A12_70055 [Vibrio jasicida]